MEAEAPRSRRKLAAILMVDVSGFSRLMARDEEWTTREIRAFHARVAARVHEYEGRVVDTAGDSVFGEFDSVVNATRCAQAIQADQVARNLTQPPERRIETRIGVHVGDVIVEEYKVYGDGVNIAARLEGLAEPGHILVSEAVYQQVRNKVSGEFEDGGMRALKNIDQPVRVYRLVPSALVPVGSRAAPPAERRARAAAGRVPAQDPPRGAARAALARPRALARRAPAAAAAQPRRGADPSERRRAARGRRVPAAEPAASGSRPAASCPPRGRSWSGSTLGRALELAARPARRHAARARHRHRCSARSFTHWSPAHRLPVPAGRRSAPRRRHRVEPAAPARRRSCRRAERATTSRAACPRRRRLGSTRRALLDREQLDLEAQRRARPGSDRRLPGGMPASP